MTAIPVWGTPTSSSGGFSRRSETTLFARCATRSRCKKARGTAGWSSPSIMTRSHLTTRACAPRTLARARPLPGSQRSVADRHRARCRRRAGAGVAVCHAAGRADEARRVLAGHPRITVRGAPLARQGRRSGRVRVRPQEPRRADSEPIGRWLVDEWRQIGTKVRHEIQSSGQYFKDLRTGNFELSTDFQCGYVVDPDLTSTSSNRAAEAMPTTAGTPIPC